MAVSIDEILAQPLSCIRTYLLSRDGPVPMAWIDALECDPRRGAKKMAGLLRKRRLEDCRETHRLNRLLKFERTLWAQGVCFIAGIDEAGMAPLAGPVVAAAVILPPEYKLPGLNDSKKITDAHRREALAVQIKQDAVCYAAARAEVEEIDKLNIYHAGILAMRRAVQGLSTKPGYMLVDARTIPDCECPQKGIIRGDAVSASIAAASIIAKTTRDAHMIEMGNKYPAYGFELHKGYPTRMHLRALKEYGALPIHRRSFAPVRAVLGIEPSQGELFRNSQ